ncbi:hypothetical protein TH25_11760 [Thalassospira profundimaris]|uniref:SnoaL-like domain-containing protein n=1 Tax=Thalassospira profundimaris TaxID=502049 RepID=A0A367X9D1_9PROT|nr:nuclear transport factor 2 family protein [Thalassospira profundimaris]RCK50276.1 hypothetical protein TH25_11760 [Thalassospira profundimaris]
MTIQLPPSIHGFFDHCNHRDWASVTRCFTTDAQIHDEKQNIDGRDAIGKWISRAVGNTDAIHDLIDATSVSSDVPTSTLLAPQTTVKISVSARVSGNFKGSPVTLGYLFTLQNDKISGLEIE